jgi:hypothetical protein
MQRAKRGTRRARATKNGKEMISHPPQINGVQLTHSTTLRYRAIAAAGALNVTFQNLLDTLLVATTAIVGFDLFQAVKIRRVRVWGMPVIGAASSVSVEFGGVTAGIVGDQIVHTDTSMGVQPAHVDCRPSKKSLASDYQVNSAAVAFILSCPAGSVIDLELTFKSQFAPAFNNAAQNALVGATAGGQYLRGMDGLAAAGTNFTPELTFAVI